MYFEASWGQEDNSSEWGMRSASYRYIFCSKPHYLLALGVLVEKKRSYTQPFEHSFLKEELSDERLGLLFI